MVGQTECFRHGGAKKHHKGTILGVCHLHGAWQGCLVGDARNQFRRIPLMGQQVASPVLRCTTIITATSCRTQSCDVTYEQIYADLNQRVVISEIYVRMLYQRSYLPLIYHRIL
jgi:hypothetical protein